MKHVILTEYCEELEREIKTKLKDKITTEKFGGFTCTEIVKLSDEFTLNDLYDKVVSIRNDIEENKKQAPAKVIHKMYAELKSLRGFKRKALKAWKLSKYIVEDHSDNFEDIRILIEGKVKISEKRELMIKFAEYLYNMCVDSSEWISNKELYNLYTDYVLRKKSEAYCFSYKKFCDEFTITFKNCFKILRRAVVKQGEPGYESGKDQTALGKEITFDEKFVTTLLQNDPVFEQI